MRYLRMTVLCSVAVLAPVVAGCIAGFAGSRGLVTFDNLEYPASMSAYRYGPNDEVLVKDKDLTVVRRFSYEKNHFGILYSFVSLSETEDIVDEINSEIKRSGGDGIINVTVTVKNGITNYFFPLTLLPFWPGYTVIRIEGDIVQTHVGSSPIPSFKTSGTVQILEEPDQAITLQLNEWCSPVGKVETATFKFPFFYVSAWSDSVLKDIEKNAIARGSNVVQILYIECGRGWYRLSGRTACFRMWMKPDVRLYARYWSCP